MRRSGRALIFAGVGVLILLLALDAAVHVYTDALWFSALGYGSVYWTRLGVTAVVRAAVGLVAAAIVFANLAMVARQLGPVHLRRRYGNLEIAEQVPRKYLLAGAAVTAVLAGWWLSGVQFDGDGALAVATWLRQVPWGARDPLLGRDVGFYVFSLPVYYSLSDFLLVTLVWTVLLVTLGYVLVGAVRTVNNRLHVSDPARLHFLFLVAGLIAIIGFRFWLGRYALLVDGSGFGGQLGYTDVHARLPVRAALAVVALLAAGSLVYGAVRRQWLPPVIGVGALLLAAVVGGAAYPGIVQKFQVEPNQLEREAPYIRWGLDFTRRAYGLDHLERRQIPFRRGTVPAWETLQPSLARLPLWDSRPLVKVLNQLQAGYGYYHFPEVDFDRYGAGAGQTQVAIAAREFYAEGLPPGSRNWLTLRLNPKYVRGMGAVVAPAAEETREGQPVLWIGNLDPVTRSAAAPPDVSLTEPSLFIGQSMTDYVLVIPGRNGAFRGRPGVDYPGGVQLGSTARLLAFAWRFGEKNLLFSGEVSGESRIVFWRSVAERVEALAPFLVWDPDPYPVLRNGRLYWIADGYTASGSFPLSRPETLEGLGDVRYLHGSVKAVIDAVTGATTFYALPGADPLLETYGRIFPGLFQPSDAIPADLRAHFRYPQMLFTAQSRVLRQFHLTSPEAFFGGLDVWELAPESVHDATPRPYQPVYALMRLPGEPAPEFVLTAPFIARQRQNMTAVLFARSDPGHYGELRLYEVPRDQQVPGPGQVQALIEQNPIISPRLTLWRQSGSDVDLGHLRVVPLDSGFIYVQPLFLSAQSTAGGQAQEIPELSQVIVSDGSAVAMDSTLAGSVQALRGETAGATTPGAAAARPAATAAPNAPAVRAGDWSGRALQLLDEADRRLRAGDFAGFGSAWKQLRAAVESASANPRR